jgi:hypothetical protein
MEGSAFVNLERRKMFESVELRFSSKAFGRSKSNTKDELNSETALAVLVNV